MADGNSFHDQQSSYTFPWNVSPAVTTDIHLSPSSLTSSSSSNRSIHHSSSTSTGTHSHLSPSNSPHFTHMPVLTSSVSLAPSSTPNLCTPFPAPYSSISSQTHQLLTPSLSGTTFLINPLTPPRVMAVTQLLTPQQHHDKATGIILVDFLNFEKRHLSLIEDAAKLNSLKYGGCNLLMIASELGNTNVVNIFLMNGAEVNIQNFKGESALMIATYHGHFEIAKALIEHNAQVNLQNNEGESALMIASCRGRVNIARLLIECGAQVNLKNNEGKSALMKACCWSRVEIAKILLDCGAKINLQDNDGESALTMASHNGHIDIARLLLENGANANIESKSGFTAILYAKSDEMVALLMLPSIPQLINLLLPIAHKWRVLGKRLGLSKATLDSFQTIQEEKSRLQAVMTAWSKQTHPQPTWRGLIRAVESVDRKVGLRMGQLHCTYHRPTLYEEPTLQENNKEESDDDTDEGAPDAEHLAAVQQAMEIKGILEHALVHGVLVGSAGSGKSSLMSRLLGEMPSSTSPSTGVANKVVQVEVRKSSSIAVSVLNTFSDSVWRKIQHDEETAGFVTQVMSYLSNQEPPSPLSGQTHPLPATPTNTEVEMSSSQTTQPFNIQSVSDGNTTLLYPTGYVTPMGMFKNALCQGRLEELRQHFENSWSLYLTDTGGQMEFQEVLPLLVSGPSIFFITFRLDQDLKQRFTIEYRLPDGGRSEPYESSLTVEEAILQTLASVASMGTFTYNGPQMKSIPLKPKVLIVGTHKDMLDQSAIESKIKEIDEHLQKLIKSTSHYHEDLVEFSSESQLIFTVNNFSEDDSDFKKIRSSVEDVVQYGAYKMSYPSHWLIFSLVLRQQMIEDRIISFDQCVAIAQDCGITDREELNHALLFLHTKIGLIRHFPTPGLKDVVIRDPQVLFDQVTHLIVKTFTFKNARKRRSTEFKKQGIFSFEDFKHVVQSPSHFLPPEKLLLLLEELRIVASFQTDEGDTKYFFPCVLAHSPVPTSPVPTPDIPPLLITFKCGYCPKGLAGALIVYLLSNKMGSKFKWKLNSDQIFRDQVSFLVSPYDFITLKIHPTFLECIHHCPALRKSSRGSMHNYKNVLERVCSRVRQFIKKGIKKVSSDLKFSDAKHSLSFYCQHADCVHSNGPHPATDCMSDEDEPCSLHCKKSGEIVISCPPAGCSVWYGKEYQDAELKGTSLTVDISTPKRQSRPPVDTSETVDSDLSMSSTSKRLKISSPSAQDEFLGAAVGLEGNSMDVVPPDDIIDLSGQIESRGSPAGSKQQQITLDESDWATICGYLYKLDRPQIKRLGGELGLSVYSLEKMQDLPGDMVRAWLRKEDNVLDKCHCGSRGTLTWNILVEKLTKIGQTGIATTILRDKCHGESSSHTSATPQLCEALKLLLPVANQWQVIAVLLSIPHHKVEAIRLKHQNINDCLLAVLTEWLKQDNPRPSWNTLAEIMELLGNPMKAKEIRDTTNV